MYLPSLQTSSASREIQTIFAGYSHTLSPSDNQFFEMSNMTGAFYPLLSPRALRSRFHSLQQPHGMLPHDSLCWVDGTSMYYDGELVGSVSDTDKQLVMMGAYILVWPDKKLFHTETKEWKSLDLLRSGNTLNHLENQEYMYAELAGASGQQDTAFVQGDVVEVSYYAFTTDLDSAKTAEDSYAERKVFVSVVDFHSNTTYMDVADLAYDDVVYTEYTGYISNRTAFEEKFPSFEFPAQKLELHRKVPDLEYIVEWNNRIWGCLSDSNELFASKLGDPSNWYCYEGTSQDSYSVNVGTPGNFTGIAAYGDSVLFFKSDSIHRVVGSRPSNFQTSTLFCSGVEPGGFRSVCQAAGRLYYKGVHGVYSFTGSMPVCISADLGQVTYTDAAAGVLGDRIYFSMRALPHGSLPSEWVQEHWELLVYDTARQFWHKEDQTQASFFAAFRGDLYFIDEDTKMLESVSGSTKPLYTGGDPGRVETGVPWSVQTGRILLSLPDHKYITRLQLSATMQAESNLKVEVRYDDDREWKIAFSGLTHRQTHYAVPLIPHRCGYMEIRISGVGDAKIHTISRYVEQGSEL